MKLGTFDPLEVKYIIRDIDTGKMKEEFRTLGAAMNYYNSMNFGLKIYYEIYGIKEKKVMCSNKEKKEGKEK